MTDLRREGFVSALELGDFFVEGSECTLLCFHFLSVLRVAGLNDLRLHGTADEVGRVI